jgi:hypothetical protein
MMAASLHALRQRERRRFDIPGRTEHANRETLVIVCGSPNADDSFAFRPEICARIAAYVIVYCVGFAT